jgi:hypothetical protein
VTTKERESIAVAQATEYLKGFWPDGIPMTAVVVKATRQTNPVSLAAWRRQVIDAMINAVREFGLLVVRLEGRSVERWAAEMPMRQLGIPLYGDDQWARMDLSAAVPVLKHIHKNPWMPHLKQVA